MNITEFLLARISEDEAVARTAAADNDSARWNVSEIVYEGIHVYARPSGLDAEGGRGETTAHMQRHDPARVLAECAAKREIVARYIRVEDRALAYRSPRWADTMNCTDRLDWRKAEARYATMDSVVRALARVYADHPDFDPTCM